MPDRGLTVTTLTGVYHFSAPDPEGNRSVRKDGVDLKFSDCKIIRLMPDEDMVLEIQGGEWAGQRWQTARVTEII